MEYFFATGGHKDLMDALLFIVGFLLVLVAFFLMWVPLGLLVTGGCMMAAAILFFN